MTYDDHKIAFVIPMTAEVVHDYDDDDDDMTDDEAYEAFMAANVHDDDHLLLADVMRRLLAMGTDRHTPEDLQHFLLNSDLAVTDDEAAAIRRATEDA